MNYIKGKRFCKKLLITVLAAFLFCSAVIPALANNRPTLKVGFYPLEGFFEMDEEGIPKGYGVEYLKKVSAYSGIKFEYVISPSWEMLGEMMRNETIDVMMPVQDTAVRPYMYAYSTDNIMHSFFCLMTLATRDDLYFEDREAIKNLKIAVDKFTAEDDIYIEYIKTNNLEKNITVYNEYNTCLNAVKTGEADALISNVMDLTHELKMLDKFGITRNYIIMRKNDSRYEDLNSAISNIKVNEPFFDANLYAKFFPERAFLPFTKAETYLIQSKTPIVVSAYPYNKPITYFNENTHEFEGIAIDMAKLVEEKTGLTFKFIPAIAGNDSDMILEKTRADVFMPACGEDCYPDNSEIAVSAPLFSSPVDFVGKAGKVPSTENRINIAVCGCKKSMENAVKSVFDHANILEFSSCEAAMESVRDGRTDLYAGSKYVTNYQLLNPANSELSSIPLLTKSNGYCMVSEGDNGKNIISIVNKGLMRISDEERNAAIYHHSMSNVYQMTPFDFIYKFRYLEIFCLIIFVGLVQFIRLKANYYKKLKIKTYEAEKANEAKSDFLSRVSHDMRTPMNAIIGFSQIALTSNSDKKELLEFMKNINASGKYMLGLINDVLDMAKIEKNNITLQKSPVDMESLVNDVSCIIEPQMEEKNISYSVELINLTHGDRVLLDAMRVKQIFINLLNNAAKFTHENGRVDFIIECRKNDNGTAEYTIIVKDSGIGMDAELLPRIFLPFVQGSASDIQRGTGLGLSIVKSLVDLMEGKITVESEVDRGSCFTVELHGELVKETAAKENHGHEKFSNIEGTHVLLCEDHPLNAQIAQRLLTNVGAVTDIVLNGEEGVKKFSDSPFGYYDAILMDIRMPVLNGFEATKQIRALVREDAKKIPIIAMTANAFDDDKEAAMACSMNAHVTKPIDPCLFYGTLSSCLSEE